MKLTGLIVNPKSYICVNAQCPGESLPHWAGFGKRTRKRCPDCGKFLIEIKGEPRGTPHGMR